jgi:hypothetical protein
MHFYFAKYRHKKYKNILTLRYIGLYYSPVYINMLNFLFIPRANVDLQRLPALSGFHKQIPVNSLIDIITALWLLANMLTPEAGKKTHFTLPRFATRFVFSAISYIIQRTLWKRLTLNSPLSVLSQKIRYTVVSITEKRFMI